MISRRNLLGIAGGLALGAGAAVPIVGALDAPPTDRPTATSVATVAANPGSRSAFEFRIARTVERAAGGERAPGFVDEWDASLRVRRERPFNSGVPSQAERPAPDSGAVGR